MPPPAAEDLSSRDRTRLLRLMMLSRVAQERARTFAASDRVALAAARWHREAIGAGAVSALGPGDRLIAPGRYRAAHFGHGDDRAVGALSTAADLVPIAVGIAHGVSARGSGEVVLTLLDHEAMASDRWTEALAFATTKRLPLVLVVERVGRGQRALATSVDDASAQPLLGEAVTAVDPEVVLTAVRAAVGRARAGRGPALVACVAGAGQPTEHVASGPGSQDREGHDSDPIEYYARRLMRTGMPRAEIESVLRAAEQEALAWPR